MIIVARLIVATVSSPMRDDIGSEWMHVAAAAAARRDDRDVTLR